jgi:hypothetical protein
MPRQTASCQRDDVAVKARRQATVFGCRRQEHFTLFVREVVVDEHKEESVPVYEPPVLVEVGAFAELTHGDQIGDYYDGVYLNWGAGT